MRKRITRISGVMAMLAALALVVVSCSGGGGGASGACAEPLALTSGTWCITIQSTQNTCSAPLNSTPYTANFIQNGTALNAVSQYGHTYAGTICGNSATMTGNNYGITTTMNMTFSDASNVAGSVDWNTGTCSGTDTYIAVAGNCGGSS